MSKASCDELSEKVVSKVLCELVEKREYFQLWGIREGCLEEAAFALGIEGWVKFQQAKMDVEGLAAQKFILVKKKKRTLRQWDLLSVF